MRKATASLSICLVMMVSPALATQTRVLTLGEVNEVVMDESNITLWPQTLRMYPDRGLADIMGGAVTTAGVHQTFGNFVLGGYWTTEDWVDPYYPGYFTAMGWLDQKLSLYYARDLAGMPFGFAFHYYGDSHEMKGTTETAHSGMGLKIGAGMTFIETLEVGFQFGILSWEEKDAVGTVVGEGEGGTQIKLDARWWHEMDEGMMMIPHAGFEMNSGGIKTPGGSTTDDDLSFGLGLGSNMRIGDMGLMVNDIGVMIMSRTVETAVGGKTEYGMTLLPYFRGGMEAPLSDHFTFRFGGVKEWMGMSQKDPNGDEETLNEAATRFYIGAGYMRGGFTLDWWVDPGFFTRGPYLISGAGGPLAMQASMRYIFGE